MTTSVLEVLRRTTAWFRERGLDAPRLDAEVLLAHGLGVRRLDLYTQFDRPLNAPELERLRALVRERGRGVPVAYLTGEREFHALAFHVTPAVLVPRPETEALVDLALAEVKDRADAVVVDVGTGSGCIALGVLHGASGARAIGTDVSAEALAVARRNAGRHGLEGRFRAAEGSLLEPARGDPRWGAFDAILSNPPYIVRGDPTVAADVAAHEPALALFVPGDDPLELVRRLAEDARAALRPGGLLAIEVGHREGAAGAALLEGLGYADVAVDADLGGIPRVVRGRRGSAT